MLRSSRLAISGLLVFGASATAQESNALFDAAVVELDASHRFNELLDWSGDGRQDAVGFFYSNSGPSQILVTGYLGGGDRFTEAWSFQQSFAPAGNFAEHSAAGRIDADGLDDFVIGIETSVFVYASDPISTPTLLAAWNQDEKIRGVAISDFDGDGLGDVAVLGIRIQLFRNLGASFELASSLPSSGLGWSEDCDGLSVAELTGDGVPDLLYSRAGGQVVVVPVVGTALLKPIVTLLGGTLGISLVRDMAGDVDGDGDVDVVLVSHSGFNTSGSGYRVLRRVGPGSFVAEPEQKGGPFTDLSDVDGDGDRDGVACYGNNSGPVSNNQAALFRVALNDGTGAFAPALTIETVGADRIAGVADVDLDGDRDLVGGRCVYYSHPSLVVDPSALIVATSDVVPQMVEDADSDGDPDVFGNSFAQVGATGYLRNAGDGTFPLHAATWPAAPVGTKFVGPGIPGDFDGDGDADLLVLHQMITGGQILGTRLLRSHGGGDFLDGGAAAPPGVYLSAFMTPELAIRADADGDGDLDVLIGLNLTVIYWNDGTGFFSSFWAAPTHVSAVANLNADAIPDLVMESGFQLGLGGGAFAPPQAYAAYGGWEPSAGDFDADGDVDVFVTAFLASSSYAIVMHVNDGAANFTATFPFGPAQSTFPGTTSFLSVEIDGDGLPDMIRNPYPQSAFSSGIYLRKPDNSGFLPPIVQVVDPTFAGDVDGDGDADLMGTTLWKSTRFEGADDGIRRQYGPSSTGSGPLRPVLGATGPFRAGESAQIRLRGAAGGGVGLLVVGLAEAAFANKPFPGMSILTFPFAIVVTVPLGGTIGTPGSGSLTFDYTVPAAAAGFSFFHQVFVADSGAPFGAASTNGLELRYGF